MDFPIGSRADAPERLSVERSYIEVPRCAGGGKGGLAMVSAARNAPNGNFHGVCNGRGRPCVLLLTRGSVDDWWVAQICIAVLPPSAELVADKGWGRRALAEWLEERVTQPVIPPRRNRKIQCDSDKAAYNRRNATERTFCRIKDWRRIATRFDRNVQSFMCAVAFAGAVIGWV